MNNLFESNYKREQRFHYSYVFSKEYQHIFNHEKSYLIHDDIIVEKNILYPYTTIF